jgi:hypothetical protein
MKQEVFKMKQSEFDIPVVFIIFNRPYTSKIVFEEIRKAKPKKLYVISDAPRNETDEKLVQESRAIIDTVDWDCEVNKNYAEKNMTCGVRVASGLDWVFSKEEYAIILEDDCVPEQTFFRYCQELLKKYKDDERIMYISGNNFHKKIDIPDSYSFVKFGWIWGWATWARAWDKYDFHVETWPEVRKSNVLKGYYNKMELKVMTRDLGYLETSNTVFTWDYQWQYTNAINSGLCIVPKCNLVNNIGFDENATHTKGKMLYYDGTTQELQFPLHHPRAIVCNSEYDRLTVIHMKGGQNRWIALTKRVIHKIKKILGLVQ